MRRTICLATICAVSIALLSTPPTVDSNPDSQIAELERRLLQVEIAIELLSSDRIPEVELLADDALTIAYELRELIYKKIPPRHRWPRGSGLLRMVDHLEDYYYSLDGRLSDLEP